MNTNWFLEERVKGIRDKVMGSSCGSVMLGDFWGKQCRSSHVNDS